MGGTTSRESPPGGSESRGGVQHVNTNAPAAESDLGKQDSTSTIVLCDSPAGLPIETAVSRVVPLGRSSVGRVSGLLRWSICVTHRQVCRALPAGRRRPHGPDGPDGRQVYQGSKFSHGAPPRTPQREFNRFQSSALIAPTLHFTPQPVHYSGSLRVGPMH